MENKFACFPYFWVTLYISVMYYTFKISLNNFEVYNAAEINTVRPVQQPLDDTMEYHKQLGREF